MKRVVINALLAFLLMLLQTGVSASFGVVSLCHFGILAALVSASLAFPTISSTISMLVLGFLFDLWVSGPTSLYALLFVVTTLIIRGVVGKFRTERLVLIVLYAAVASAFFDFVQCLAYSLYYRDSLYWHVLSQVILGDMGWTALFAAPYMWAVLLLDRVIAKRRTGRLS